MADGLCRDGAAAGPAEDPRRCAVQPHNPCGRVWERWELEKAMELFRKYDVYVVSDEIWSDLLLDGRKHIPTQSISEDARMRTTTLYAPSKTFNLAGLVGATTSCTTIGGGTGWTGSPPCPITT